MNFQMVQLFLFQFPNISTNTLYINEKYIEIFYINSKHLLRHYVIPMFLLLIDKLLHKWDQDLRTSFISNIMPFVAF